jgi:hypothetical protein
LSPRRSFSWDLFASAFAFAIAFIFCLLVGPWGGA